MGWQEEPCRVSRVEGSLEGYGICGGGDSRRIRTFQGVSSGRLLGRIGDIWAGILGGYELFRVSIGRRYFRGGSRSKSRFRLKGGTKGPCSYIVYTWALK